MKKRSIGPLLAAASVVLPGGVAAIVVLRTLAVYWARDWAASAIVLAIAAALLMGLVELLVRQQLAAQLEAELAGLPTRPREATLDIVSPRLGALLRARLEHAPSPSFGDGIASYLTGLLVMLGLLGTLLGLFQTLQGAGHALTASADVAALRRSLGGPIAGLTRSFGCSAAGISASAMLGLALALVRRRESRALRAVHAYAAGPLRSLSANARQLRALEQLASQSQTSGAIESIGEKLGELTTRLHALHEHSLEAQQRALRELLASVPGELIKAASHTGEALHAHVAPLFEQLTARSAETLAAQSNAMSDLSLELRAQLERDAKLRRHDTADALEALRARFAEADSARQAAHARELAAASEQHSATLAASERLEREWSASWRELASQLEAAHERETERLRSLDAQLEATREREAERLRELDAQALAAREHETERLRELDAQALAAREQAAERLRELDEQALAAREREHEQLQRLAGLSSEVGSELARLSGELCAQLDQRQASERGQVERTERALAQLEAATNAIQHGIARQESALERLPALFDAAAHGSQASVQAALEQLIAHGEQRVADVSQLFSGEIATRAAETQAWTERLDRSAALLDDAIARQSGGLHELSKRVAALLPELVDAAQSGAASTLARLGELADQQATRLVELERGLDRGRELQSRVFADQLTGHAAELEQRLTRTGDAVHEAATTWQASSIEMQAVAQLFASSVERQREASDAWLESLGQIEAAVEDAGRRSASDVLADQLASTHELFARQLQFQRELFEQLRGLRGAAAKPAFANGGRGAAARK